MSSDNGLRIALFAVLMVFVGGWIANARAAGLSRSTFYTPSEGCFVVVHRPTGVAQVERVAASAPVLVLVFWILRALGRNFSTSLAESETLVTSGPYRLVRHPMYAAFLLL